MYKVASANRQSALDRGRLADWMNGEHVETPHELYKSLVNAINGIERDLLVADKGQKRALGARKLDLQNQIKALRPILQMKRRTENFVDYFVTAAREILSKGQFATIMNAARADYDKERAVIDDVLPDKGSAER